MSLEELKTWGFITEIPEGDGGSQPSLEGNLSKCDRCGQPFMVKRKTESDQECIYHWGRPYYRTENGGWRFTCNPLGFILIGVGERHRVYRCCSKLVGDADGCTHGQGHVFYESKPEELHARHPFTFLKAPSASSTTLDAVALDCEMIYTTGKRPCYIGMAYLVVTIMCRRRDACRSRFGGRRFWH